MAKSIACFANKGGTGKTTSVINIGGIFAEQGARVLMIDMDPQSSLSKFFLGSDGVHELYPNQTVASLFDEACIPSPEDLVHATAFENIFVTPASEHLKKHNKPEPHKLGELQAVLRDYVTEVESAFDFIMIDCPPDVSNLPTRASLIAADYAIAPILPERFSIQAIAGVDTELAKARDLNNQLVFLGYILSQRRSRLGLHDATEDNLRSVQGERVFETVLPTAVAFAEAQQMGKPITAYDATTTAAKISAQLAAEVLTRIANQSQQRRAA
jgi:chromosome partitioning protein